MGEVIQLAIIRELSEEIERLNQELSDLFYERDHLKLVVCENIQTQYMLVFGYLEYELQRCYLQFYRLRRKKELLQIKINRQEAIDLDSIDSQLDLEFAEYQQQLNEKFEEIEEALERAELESLSEADSQQIKKLYRAIVKRLHPDLHPNVTEREIRLFKLATEAYKMGDLDTIWTIYQMMDDLSDDLEASTTLDYLKQRIETLTKTIKNVKFEIKRIKSNVPYVLRKYLITQTAKTEKKAALEQDIDAYKQAIRTQEEAIEQLMRRAK